jgi:hypothetical protein
MGLDVRLPIGLMFAIMGLLLAGYGMLAARTDGAGLNVTWGLVMLAVGALMVWLSRRSRK